MPHVGIEAQARAVGPEHHDRIERIDQVMGVFRVIDKGRLQPMGLVRRRFRLRRQDMGRRNISRAN